MKQKIDSADHSSGANQRRFPREPLQLPLIYTPNQGYGVSGYSKDISITGVFLKADTSSVDIKEGEQGYLVLDSGKGERFPCRIVRNLEGGLAIEIQQDYHAPFGSEIIKRVVE
jgi:hypothetical protein